MDTYLSTTDLAALVNREPVAVKRACQNPVKRARLGAIKLARDWRIPAQAPDGRAWSEAVWQELVGKPGWQAGKARGKGGQ